MSQNCGCRVNPYAEVTIAYCPLHQAAPALKTALDEAIMAHGWIRLQEDANKHSRIKKWIELVATAEGR